MMSKFQTAIYNIQHNASQTIAHRPPEQSANRIARDGNRARGPASEKVQEVVLIGGGALVPAEVLPLLLGELTVLVAEEDALALRILIAPVDLDEVVAVFGHLENACGLGRFPSRAMRFGRLFERSVSCCWGCSVLYISSFHIAVWTFDIIIHICVL